MLTMDPMLTCTNCGAELSSEARFCRNCGQRSSRYNPESVTEGTTRLLETPERPPIFGQQLDEQPGSLAHATSHIPQQATTTRGLEPVPKSQNHTVLLLSVALIAVFALLVTVLLIKTQGRAGSVAPPVPTVVLGGGAPVIQPPPPPGPPSATVIHGGPVDPTLFYPGARTVMEITGEDEGHVVQLQTSDTLDRVAAWYINRLKPSKIVRMNGSQVVLESEEMSVVINSGGNSTNIILKQGDD